jgi:autotransporter translocation and assembly factor TamB
VGKRWLRRIGIAAAILAALVVVAVVAARVFVGSDRGRHAVERKIDRTVARATSAGGHVHIGHIAGSLVGGATLDDVEWRDRAGHVAMRARRVVARWSAARAVARRPAIELRVEAPFVDVDRLASGLDFDEAAHWLENKGEEIDAITVTKLDVSDATVVVDGVRIGGVRLSGGLGLDRVAHRLEADRLAVRAGESGATLNGTVTRDAVDLRMTSLRVGPDDLRPLSPRAAAPRTPLVGEARIHGRLDAAMVRGELRPDGGRAVVAGTIDLRRRRAQLRVTLDDVETDYTTAVLAGQVRLHGAIDRGALALDWASDGHYFRREVDPNLQEALTRARRFATVRPGGRFTGRGRLVAHLEGDGAPAAQMRFRLRVDDPGQAARVLAGPDLRAATEPVVIDGDWRLPPHAPATLTLHREHQR